MKAQARGTAVALAVVLLASGAWLILWRVAPPPSGQASVRLRTVARQERDAVTRRLVATRLVVDSMHEGNRRSLAERRRMRSADSLIRSVERPTVTRSEPLPADVVGCARRLRADDRLVRDLQLEIDKTRDLVKDYQRLMVAYRREVEACDAVLEDCRRATRRRQRRHRTLVAAAAVVVLIVILD